MSDEEDPLVTKPFKFVTGKSPFNVLDAMLLMLFAAGILLSFSSTFSKRFLCFTYNLDSLETFFDSLYSSN